MRRSTSYALIVGLANVSYLDIMGFRDFTLGLNMPYFAEMAILSCFNIIIICALSVVADRSFDQK